MVYDLHQITWLGKMQKEKREKEDEEVDRRRDDLISHKRRRLGSTQRLGEDLKPNGWRKQDVVWPRCKIFVA
jgi:hypothetical protein